MINMIDAHKIVYNNLSSEEFDVTLHCSFDGDNGTTSSFLSREGVYTEHYDGHRTIHRVKNNEVLTPRFTLIKKDFSDFTPSENRRVLSWLTSSDKPGWFEVYKDDSNVIEWRIFGYVAPVEQYKLGNDRVVGYEFEVESSHPYAWSRKFIYPEVHATTAEINNNDETNDYLQVSGTKNFTITCNTDEYNKPVYPKVTVTFKGKNQYFPIDVNPLEENTYQMVPNVIYSWTDTNNVEHLYVNLNGTEDNGRYAIQAISGSSEPSGAFTDYAYYYFTDDGYIKKLVSTTNNGIASYAWKSIAHIGMAVKINNTYTMNGKSVTKEAIVAGGTLDETIVLDGTNKIISGTKGATTRIVGDDFNWEWIPLVYGENNITVSGNCTIKFEWLEPHKVGSL
jgi:hypothetical protein